MAGKNTAAFGIFPTRNAAEAAVDRLTAAGFPNQDVSVLMSDSAGSQDFATEKNTKAPEGTATGVGVGGITGGTLGLLAGLGALAIPGVGPLIAAGPIMATPSTKPSATKAASRTAASWRPFTAKAPKRSAAPRRSSERPAPKISPRPTKNRAAPPPAPR